MIFRTPIGGRAISSLVTVISFAAAAGCGPKMAAPGGPLLVNYDEQLKVRWSVTTPA